MDLKKKLEEEIAALDFELRVDLPREIAKARAHGDLSENAEYHAAKERQGIVNARIGQLGATLHIGPSARLSVRPYRRQVDEWPGLAPPQSPLTRNRSL